MRARVIIPALKQELLPSRAPRAPRERAVLFADSAEFCNSSRLVPPRRSLVSDILILWNQDEPTSRKSLAADERRRTLIREFFVLSAFICVHRRPKFLFSSPVTEFRSEFVDGRHGEKRLIRVPRSLAPYPCRIIMSEPPRCCRQERLRHEVNFTAGFRKAN